MHDLTAQVTSSLLPFPGVTINALGEDEITLDSVLHGKFTVGRSGLAWLACGPHLEAVHAITGERLSAYNFSGGGEHPPCILAARDFSWLKRSGLLIGLEEVEGSVLCLYDLGLSRVVKAVVIPGRITAIEPLVSYGGASMSTQHLHQSLRWFFGIAAVGTDLGHVLLVDLCLDDLSCSQNELEASDLQVVTKSPAEIPRLREVSSREGRHLCLQLNAATGVGATAMQYISRTNQLAVGFSDGYLQLWNMKALKKEYHSQLEGGRVPVHAFTFQEPENDPRNCCYLWAVQSSQDFEGDMVTLRLLQLAFSERKCLASGKILYEGLEYCEERYSQELSGTAYPLRAQATSTRLLTCQTIEKFRPHLDRDDSMNEAASPDTSVSIFSWQIKAYGQGTPATYIGVFDINRWYHAQMPDSLRTGESLQNCPYLAVWSLDAVMQMVSPHVLLDVVVYDRSLSRGLPYSCPPPEQYFNPTTYNFDGTCLLNTGIVHLTCSGYQKETLGFLKKAAPCSSDLISTSYSRCLMSGLLSSRLADTQASSLTQEEQLDAILCTAVETSSLGLITGCIKQWTAEEQPGSALNLRYILDWAWNKVVQTKEELDGICAPLFDSSSNFTDPQTMQLLQHSQRLLTNLSTIFHCLISEAQELTQKGLVGLMNKNMVSTLISKYAQVVLWFCRTGLLPEGSDDDALQISRPFYSHSVISNYYTIRREELTRLAKGKWCADSLMIDGLVGQCGERLAKIWKRDDGGTGQYPPPTLHALLDIYLLDNIDEAAKHAIVIYLLLDVMYAFSNKEGASVESFPTAFAIPIGLVKLVQGLWLLDHHDHQSAFELLLHPAASPCQFEWQHERILQALMCQGQHSAALRYFHVTKHPIASISQAKLCLCVLLHNRCLIEAWSLIRQHSNHLNISELLGFLYETCQELGLMKEVLKLPLGITEQDCLEKFLQGTGGLQNRELLMVHYLQQANYIPALQLNHSLKMNLVNERDPKLKEQSNTRNAILEQYGKVLPRVQKKLAMERAKPYQHPLSIHREVSRPQPLSTITKRAPNEKVISRAGFISNVLTKIEEVWIGKGATPQSSPAKTLKAADMRSPEPSSSALPNPFLGTPITLSSKRKSRLMKLVVQPSCQMPQTLLSPSRPPNAWVSPKSISKASELSLLQTPQVVKRARALAASGPVFTAFTPQSILRSSLRPTPVATPSASPGRSITPPLRKENRITFIEEAESPELEKNICWANGVAADNEINFLTRGTLRSKATCKSWSSQVDEVEEDGHEEEPQSSVKFLLPEGEIPSPEPRLTKRDSLSVPEVTEESKPSGSQLVLSFETSQTSAQSTDTILEFYDAPLSEGQEDSHSVENKDEDSDDGIVSISAPAEGLKPQFVLALEQTGLEGTEEEGPEAEEHKEDTTETGAAQEGINEVVEDVQSEKMDVTAGTKQEVAVTLTEGALSTDGFNEMVEASDSQCEDLCRKPDVQNEESTIAEFTEYNEVLVPSEESEPEPEDLTEFVERHLFGSDLSPPLVRSGIHSTSLTQTSINSESVDQDEEEAPANAAPLFTCQKSTTSGTSSDLTGTDSHSVVSVNDSEELSSPVSEEEDEGEESDQAEEEEDGDSGSEVEIIEEIQGNGRLPRLQPSLFAQQGQAYFLPTVSEQEADAFSAEIKTAEEETVGEVVMVRLGANEEGMDQDEEEQQRESYVELIPSTTLLVPLELVEGQDALVNAAEHGFSEIYQNSEPNDLKTENQSNFSLMLDLDEDGEKEPQPQESNLLSSDTFQCVVKEASGELDVIPEVSVVDCNDIDIPDSEVLKEDGKKEMECTEMDTLQPQDEIETENTLENQMTEDTEQDREVQLDTEKQGKENETELQSEDLKRQIHSAPEPAEEPPVVWYEKEIKETALENTLSEEDKTEPADNPKEPEKPHKDTLISNTEEVQAVDSERELKAVSVCVEKDNKEESEKGNKKKKETKRTKGRLKKEETIVVKPEQQVDGAPEEQSLLETPRSSRRNKAPYTLGRRTTRASGTISFISPVPEETHGTEEKKEPEEERSTAVTTSLSRSTRRNKQVKENILVSTPRRSTRKTHPDPKQEVLGGNNTVTSTTKTLSPGRRRGSQKATSTRTGQQSSSEEVEATTEEELKQQEAGTDEVAPTKVSVQAGKTSTKRKTAPTGTLRRSSRRTAAPEPLDILEEKDEVTSTLVKRSSRNTQVESSLLAPVEDEKDRKAQTPGRTTRQSKRVTLYPQVKLVPVSLPQSVKKTQRENSQDDCNPKPKSHADNALRLTGKKLWDHPEVELPLLDPPLEVDSKTPVADALIRRLQDEKEKQEVVTKSHTRIRKRHTKSVVDPVPPVENSLLFDPDDKCSPGESSFIYSPLRSRTRAKRAELPGRLASVTRSRRKVSPADVGPPQDEISDDHVELDKMFNTRKTVTRITRSKLEPALIAEVDLLSPLPSPAYPLPRAHKRTEEVPTSTMNLRRKRIMDSVLTKPVTRRKKL